ncbi:MAG: tetratricopeptide repeat-containing sensor histidine kinase, partial [Cyclobacteriaceae bacterium]|nr:tetratricopeptide repeat-containing sensor histidine kinase [Cyclobacteriaceae bacterium]
HNIGRVLKELGQYENAIEYLQRSMKLGNIIGDVEGPAYAYDEMGKVYLRQKKYYDAVDAFGKSIEVSKQYDLKIIESETLIKRAEAYKLLKKYDESLEDLNRAMLYGTELGNNDVRAEALSNIATINIIRNKYAIAEQQLVEALSLAQEINSLSVITSCYLHFFELYDRKNDYEKSLLYYKRYIYHRDSMLIAQRNEQTAQLQLQYNIDKKDLEIALLNERDQAKLNELSNQKGLNNILAVILALSVFLLFTVYRSGQRRKKINSLLRMHQEETEEQKMELLELNNLKDKFFSIIAHDLRSPISSLGGVIDLLTGKNLTQDEMNMLLKTIRKQLDYTKELLDNLLDWALLQMDKLKVSKEALDLKKLVEDNIELVKKTSIKHIDINNHVKDSVMINADKNMINLVMRNLLTNAIKFTNEGGNITVSKEKDNGEVIITVKDNGVGISEENISKLFDRSQYFSTKGTANEKGAGLGLKLCQEFIERNGGRVWAESVEGEGSSFKFSLEEVEMV